MGNSFNIYSFFALLGCLLCGLLFAWLLYGKSPSLNRYLRILLAVLRTVTVTLILWLLFAPLINLVSYTLEKPIIIIAQDNSQSAGTFLPPDFNPDKYQKELRQLSDELSTRYEVRTYSFSDKVGTGLDFAYKGKLTNAELLISQLDNELMNRNVGAVILATDGIFNRGGNPNGLMNWNAPVYTIALGDTIPKKDVLVTNVNSNELVYLDNEFIMEVQLQAYSCKGQQTILTVRADGKLVHTSQVIINDDSFYKNIPVRLKASSVGQHQYTITLAALKGEISLKNNERRLSVEVIDDRQKVLIAAAAPHPDIAALKSAVALNKHNEASVVIVDQLQGVDPKKYALVILYQLPSVDFDASSFIARVTAAKTPVWYILGAQSNVGRFNQLQPTVNLSGFTGSLKYTYSDVSKSFSVFDLDAVSRKAIGEFDALQSPSGQVSISGLSQSVLDQRNSKTPSGQPQLFFTTANGTKAGYLIGEGVWKWKLAEARETPNSPVFNGLISKVVQYLSIKDDKRKFKVYPAKQSFDENEQVLLNATLYNDSYRPVNTPDVNVELKNEKGKSYRYTFTRFGSAYQLSAGILPTGNYSYKANTALGGQKYEVKGAFFINVLDAEFQQTIANHHLLYQLSNQTKGKLYAPDQLLKIKDELARSEQMKTLSFEDRSYEPLINFKWLFFLILILLSTEWFLRKRNAVR
jgi:hypothetical protein